MGTHRPLTTVLKERDDSVEAVEDDTVLGPHDQRHAIRQREGTIRLCRLTGRFLVVTEGMVRMSRAGRVLGLLQAGDLLGLEAVAHLSGFTYQADFAIVADVYNAATVLDSCKENSELLFALVQLLTVTSSMYAELLSGEQQSGFEIPPQIRSFAAGQTILREGDAADIVYTVAEGKAGVFLRGQRVGEVLRNEIFGAIAVLTNTVRTATVIAEENCVVVGVSKDQFEAMIRTHPHTVYRLVESMARSLVDMNKRVIS